MPGYLYACDPDKNIPCNKKLCFINGGPCSKTKNLDFAMQPVKTVTMVLEMDNEVMTGGNEDVTEQED